MPHLPGTSYLHPSSLPLCSHAYALTKKSAARIVRLFRNPLYAYSRPLGESRQVIRRTGYSILLNADHGFLYLYTWHLTRLFSVYPAIVTQSKVTESDIVPGIGAGEEFYLVDSALKRIAQWEASISGDL
jgi:hypothetical protein